MTWITWDCQAPKYPCRVSNPPITLVTPIPKYCWGTALDKCNRCDKIWKFTIHPSPSYLAIHLHVTCGKCRCVSTNRVDHLCFMACWIGPQQMDLPGMTNQIGVWSTLRTLNQWSCHTTPKEVLWSDIVHRLAVLIRGFTCLQNGFYGLNNNQMLGPTVWTEAIVL